MNALVAALVVALLIPLSLAACGGSQHTSHGAPEDRRPEAYRDSDDETILTYGNAAGRAETHAVTNLVKRYYAAAAADDGSTACALTAPAFASTIPQYHQEELHSNAPQGTIALLRDAKTCTTILSLLFKKLHAELAKPVVVTSVRLKGNYGYAFVGSPTLPANFIAIGYEAGSWKIDGLLGRPVP